MNVNVRLPAIARDGNVIENEVVSISLHMRARSTCFPQAVRRKQNSLLWKEGWQNQEILDAGLSQPEELGKQKRYHESGWAGS